MAVFSGVVQVLPFPIAGPVPVWRTAFCWVALMPLLIALTGEDAQGRPLGARRGAVLSYSAGFLWYLGNCYWIYATMHEYGGIAKPAAAGILVLFCLYLGLYHALFGALVAAFRKGRWGVRGALLLSPFAWVAVELARARITGLPWDLMGIAQVDNPLLVRLAPVTGAYGLSFLIAGVNALWLTRITLRERKHTRTVLSVMGVAAVVIYVALLRTMEVPRSVAPTATAVLMQENLEVGAANTGPQLSKTDMLRTFSGMSVSPPNTPVCNGIPELSTTTCAVSIYKMICLSVGKACLWPRDIVIWPESPAPFEESDPQFREAISDLARETEAPVIVGNIGIDRDASTKRGYDLRNSADFVAANGSFVGRYDKMHLVPFGEYVPFKNFFFFAGSLLDDVGSFDPGTARTMFTTGGHTYGTFICYESIFADEMRQYALHGADVLVNISNDGWYGDTSAAWQHLNMVRMRAAENHRWVLRATNTGVTASIDPYGRVVEAAPRHIRTALRVRFGYETDVTFYARYGDWFAYLCALVTAGGLGFVMMSAASAGQRRFPSGMTNETK
jgi:apolipoprotein N-acyltransferase